MSDEETNPTGCLWLLALLVVISFPGVLLRYTLASSVTIVGALGAFGLGRPPWTSEFPLRLSWLRMVGLFTAALSGLGAHWLDRELL